MSLLLTGTGILLLGVLVWITRPVVSTAFIPIRTRSPVHGKGDARRRR